MLPKQLLTKKLLIVFGVCAALIVVVIGYYLKPYFKVSQDRTLEKTSLSIAPIQNPKSNFQYFQFVLPDSQRNIIQCEKYSDYELSFKCYTALAVLHKDASHCNNIGKSFETGLMHRDSCFYDVAIETQNVALCESIGNKDALTGDYVSCIASIKKDVSECPPLGEPYNGSYSCYMSVATAKKDLSVCDMFGNDKSSKLTCYENVAETKQDASICELGNPTSEQKDHCYINLTRTQNQDKALCEKIENKQFKDSCKYRIVRGTAVRNNNIGICNNFPDQDRKNDCFWEVAYGQNNPSMCEFIKPDKYDLDTNQCVVQSSPAIADPSICDSLKGIHYDTLNRDLCYFQYATVNQKPTSCEKISESSFKAKCLKEISNQ